jgi:hypothetical protein
VVVKAKENIRHNGKLYESGTTIDFLDSSEEKRLVNLNSAEYLEGGSPKKDSINNGGEVPPDDLDEISPGEYKDLFNSIDDAGNKEQVIDAAVSVEVELTEEEMKTKKATIHAIIEQGLEEEVLAELEKGE